ncbi:MAG TPA: GMC family oxidoreductase [Baekduia sp.]|jgi:gluconate 2-dehydrogenase alpha chain|nr:GMC family oxidoreductase [Baekduia sp.]
MALDRVDAVCIGMGWTGGIMAAELTKAGMTVVGLERGGGQRNSEDFQQDHDELAYSVRGQLYQDFSTEALTLRHDLRERALPIRRIASFCPGTGVGGAGVHWNGQTFRYHPSDFRMRSETIERYGAGKIPDGMSIQDWGITYEELEPYYDRFEYMAGIAGRAGNIRGAIRPGGNPFEGARDRDYALGPMQESYAGAVFGETAAQLGYHPFPQPSANLPEAYVNPQGVSRSHCLYCGFCENYGCEVGAKADPNVTVIPEAMKTGRFELRTGANVVRIVHDGKQGKAVQYYDRAGRLQEQPADVILVTAWVFNNARLLLVSDIGEPYDPQTGRGVIGRNYAYQIMPTPARAFFKDKDFHPFMGSGANGVVVDDLNADNFDHAGLDFIGGGALIAESTGIRPILGLQVPPDVPKWGARWKQSIRDNYRGTLSVLIQGQSPSYRTHYLDLDPTYRDAAGLPLVRMTFDFQDNERRMGAYLGAKSADIVRAMNPDAVAGHGVAGALEPHYDVTRYQTTHNTGGVIMGSDPQHSAVNTYQQLWDFPNIFVIGASSFPQNAGLNPTGTVAALAYRTAEAIVDRYRRRPGPLVG